MGSCSWIVGKYLNRGRERAPEILGLCRHAIAWLAGYGLTFVALGMTAAEIISAELQGWIITALLVLLILAAMFWFLWKAVYHRKFQYSMHSLIALTFLVAICCSILKVLEYDISNIDNLHLSTRISPHGWYGVDASVIQDVILPKLGVWVWAFMQWMAYAGHYVSVGVAVVLLVCWYNVRFKRLFSGTAIQSHSRWAGMLTSSGRSMIIVAILWILAYLLVVPSMMQSAEEAYQIQMDYVRNPNKYQESLKASIAEIRADKDWMKWHQSDTLDTN